MREGIIVMNIYDAYEILKKRHPNVYATHGFEYKNLFVFDTCSGMIGMPYAVSKDTKKVFLLNIMREDPRLLSKAYSTTAVKLR